MKLGVGELIIDHLKIFGYIAYVHVPDETFKKTLTIRLKNVSFLV